MAQWPPLSSVAVNGRPPILRRLAGRRRPGRHVWLEGVVLATLALVAVWQLVVPPPVGLADNGDFPRIMGAFAIGHPSEDYDERYFSFFISRFRIGQEFRWLSGFVSSELPLVALALALNRFVSPAGWFDIRTLGLVHTFLLLFASWWLLRLARGSGPLARGVVAVALLLIPLDVGYLAYFNSFYSEPASLLFLLLTMAWYLRLLGGEKAELGDLVAFAAVAGLFVLAKPQNWPLGPVVAWVTWRLAALREQQRWKVVARGAAATLLLISLAYSQVLPKTMREVVVYISVFTEMLAHSPDAEQDLRDLGLDPGLARFAGTNPFMPATPASDPAFRSMLTERVGLATLGRFYVLRPARLARALERSAAEALTIRPAGLGNFEKGKGLPPRSRSSAFGYWSKGRVAILRPSLARLAVLFAAYAGGLLLFHVRSKSLRSQLRIEGLAACLAMATVQFVGVTIVQGTIESAKQMFLFSVLVDVCIVAAVIGLATELRQRIARRAQSQPGGRGGKRRRPAPRCRPSFGWLLWVTGCGAPGRRR